MLWYYGLSRFQERDTNLERVFGKKSIFHKGANCILSTDVLSGKLSKSAKIRLSKSIFYVKKRPNLSKKKFSLKNINSGPHFL